LEADVTAELFAEAPVDVTSLAGAEIELVPVEMATPVQSQPSENGSHDPRIYELEGKLRDLENERSEGFINEAEYLEASAALREQIAELSKPVHGEAPTRGNTEQPEFTDTAPVIQAEPSASIPSIQAQLGKLARREKRLNDERDDGDIPQAEYDLKLAEIARERAALADAMQREVTPADIQVALDKVARRERRAQEAFDDGEIDQAEYDRRLAEIVSERVRLEVAVQGHTRLSAQERQAALDKLARREHRAQEAFDDDEIDGAEYERRLAEIGRERMALED
jgi:hypothetical protein